MINVNGLKRNAKNIVKKYSDAQIRVREATSNDPWGPSSTIMAEIADLTNNVVAFSEIMQMIWKRLNDHGKNWRHVYKALVVLEYLIKTGTDKVAQQCKENIFAIETLKDFQYMEENKDHGMNIREKSKKLVDLLRDPEKLKAERARAIKAKSRLAESMSSGGNASSSSTISNTSTALGTTSSSVLVQSPHELDSARPQTATEEENQLKLALALSQEEAEQQEKTRKNDELRLKLALDVSKKTASSTSPAAAAVTIASPLTDLTTPATTSSSNVTSGTKTNFMDDLIGLSIPPPAPAPHPPPLDDPWSSVSVAQNDPWQPIRNNNQSVTTLSSTMPTTNTIQPLVALPLTTSTLTTTTTTVPKRPMSKNPFED